MRVGIRDLGMRRIIRLTRTSLVQFRGYILVLIKRSHGIYLILVETPEIHDSADVDGEPEVESEERGVVTSV